MAPLQPLIRWTDISNKTGLPDLIQLLNRRLSGLGQQGSKLVIEFNIDGGGSVITAGDKMELNFPDFPMVINGWQLTAKPATTCVLDLWKKAYGGGLPTVANTIISVAGAKPSLTAAVENRSLTVARWVTPVAAGAKMTLNVDSNNLATRMCLTLSARKA